MQKQNNKDVASSDAVAAETTGLVADFIRGKDGKDFRFLIPLASLPWDNDTFRMKCVMATGGAITWRSGTSLKILPGNGGVVDAETFCKAVYALDFRGDEKPNAADIKGAKVILNSIESKMYTAEDAVKAIKKQYGWEIEATADGFAKHEMLKRLKIAAAKGTTVALDVL